MLPVFARKPIDQDRISSSGDVDSLDLLHSIGPYRIVGRIGTGGMANVYLARMDGPEGFQKWVAIKKTHASLVENVMFVNMFLDEARVASRIAHPNVAMVFDVGKDEGSYWIAMEYLHGESLRTVMQRTEELGTAMPPEIVCHVIADVAAGLHAAHELCDKDGAKIGLVHRDVTPHNILVTYDGIAKVVDFGVAKFASRTSQTEDGSLKGKLAYMSPEQIDGELVDRRTDVFALGVVLWELTTGHRLFHTACELDTLARVRACEVPRPSTLVSTYPSALEGVVMKALSKDPGQRFETARELSRALRSLLMRSGRLIASDEVRTCMHALFRERIEQRAAHLCWEVHEPEGVRSALARSERASTTSETIPLAENDVDDVDEAIWDAPTIDNVGRNGNGEPPASLRTELLPARSHRTTTRWRVESRGPAPSSHAWSGPVSSSGRNAATHRTHPNPSGRRALLAVGAASCALALVLAIAVFMLRPVAAVATYATGRGVNSASGTTAPEPSSRAMPRQAEPTVSPIAVVTPAKPVATAVAARRGRRATAR